MPRRQTVPAHSLGSWYQGQAHLDLVGQWLGLGSTQGRVPERRGRQSERVGQVEHRQRLVSLLVTPAAARLRQRSFATHPVRRVPLWECLHLLLHRPPVLSE